MGCFFSFISCVWIWYCYLQISIWEVFVMAAVFGIGGTFMLIGSLSLTADLIDDNKVSKIRSLLHYCSLIGEKKAFKPREREIQYKGH